MKIKKLKIKLRFCILISFITLYTLHFTHSGYALNLDKAKAYFLKGDYQDCISECENILAKSRYSRDLDELYFLLGLSYLKTENFLRSYDCLEIIIKEFKDSSYKEEAMLGQADIYFLKQDYRSAQALYNQILQNNPYSRLMPLIYFRLAQVNLKMGSWFEARQYEEKLSQNFALSFEKRLAENIPQQELYFTVQVGAFTKKENAQNLCQKLNEKGYSSFIEATDSKFGRMYRVRVGKLNTLNEAKELEKKLIQEGYPTKIFP